MRQQAWLAAAPAPKTKALSPSTRSGRAEEPVSRAQQMRASGVVPQLPPAPLPHLVEWLFEIGPTVPAGMSAGPIGWTDIEAWQRLTGIELLAWEARTIRRLSADFVGELHKAREPDRPAPWTPEPQQRTSREAVARKIGNAFKALAVAQRGVERKRNRTK